MKSPSIISLAEHFAELEDPRVERTRVHPLINIVLIGLCAVICGAQSFTQMEQFGKAKRQWLSKFLDLSRGIPSHDTFNKVFARLKPEQFEKCLLSWISALHEATEGGIIAIDGKTLRGSYNPRDGKAAIHMVSAWATANHLSLASRVVDEKSNEIPAIPPLLEMLELRGALVTLDAMGFQKEIAGKIRQGGGHYVLQVKENQPTLYEEVSSFFLDRLENDFAGEPCRRHATRDKGHGRRDERDYCIAPVPEDFPLREQWPDLKALGMAIRETECQGESSCEVHYYILSRYVSGKRFAEAVRGHWGIENNLHWQLDVTFREDDLHIYKGHAPANMSILMRTALSLLKHEETNGGSVQTKRMVAGWNDAYLEKVLAGATT